MAIEIIDSLTFNGNTYTFNVPDWVKSACRSHPTSDYNEDSSNYSTHYALYQQMFNTYPFCYRQSYSTYPDGNPSNITLQTGISGCYFHWENASQVKSMQLYAYSSEVAGVSSGGFDYNRWGWLFGIDESTQKGYCWRIVLGANSTPSSSNCRFRLNGYVGGNSTNLYNMLKAIITPPPIVYNWQSVPSISGKNGILSLSMIKDDKLGDLTGGSGLSESEYMDRFTSQSNLYGYGNNMAKGDEITIAYSGENYLNLYKDNTGYLYLKFYFRSGVLIYTSPQFVTYPTSPKYLCMVIDEEQHVVQPIVVTYYPSSDTVEWSSYNPSDTEMSALYSWLQYGTPEASPYLQGSSDNGGDNYHLTPQDDFESNLFPNLTGLATHLFTVYCPTDSQLQSLSNFLWSDDLISNIKKYFGNVSEAIVSLYMLPYKPENLPTKKFKIGSVTYDDGPSDVEYLSNTRYVTVSMGSFPIDPTFDSYLDYEPYTKLSIYLPFIGIQQLSVDEFMCKAEKSGALSESTGSTIDIEYRIDLLTGGCVAYIKQGTQVKYQFSGKCGATLPISGQNYNNMVGGLVQAISGFATTIASGGLTAPMSISASVSGTVNASKPDLFKAGNLSGELSLLSYNRPMIIKTRPNINIDMADQIKVDGLPSYKVKTVGSYSGFISCIAVHVDGINCTQEEKDKIHSYLLEGVIV